MNLEQWFSTFLSVWTDPFHCTHNRCGHLRFVNVFSIIIDKLDLVAS